MFKRTMNEKNKTIELKNFLNNKNHIDILNNITEGVLVTDLDRRIIFWNKGAEKITQYSVSDVLGKHCWEGILCTMNENGTNICETETCPLLISINTDKLYESELFLLHKKGQRIPVIIRAIPLRNARSELIGAVEIFTDNSMKVSVREKMDELTRLAMLDPTTGIGTRKFIEINLHTLLQEMKRYGWTFGIVFGDIDYFKKVNDNYGHDIGDMILKMIGKTLSNNLRSFDIMGRWGGDEFLGLLLNVNEKQLLSIAEKLRLLVSQSNLSTGDVRISVTISIGATLARRNDTLRSLIKRVDTLMYKSKANGRNLVTIDTKMQ